MDADGLLDALGLMLAETDALVDVEGDNDADGETEALAEALGDNDADGD